jgi:hypothetical protein
MFGAEGMAGLGACAPMYGPPGCKTDGAIVRRGAAG